MRLDINPGLCVIPIFAEQARQSDNLVYKTSVLQLRTSIIYMPHGVIDLSPLCVHPTNDGLSVLTVYAPQRTPQLHPERIEGTVGA